MTLNIAQQNKDYTLVSWGAQGPWNPIPIVRGEGVYIYDAEGKRYLDWASQLVNVNIGHSHPHVVKAIQDQAAQLCYVNPSFATEPRGRLGEMLAEVTPGNLSKTFFTNGGADAIENAMKIARLYTGRAENPDALQVVSRRHIRVGDGGRRPAPSRQRAGRPLDRPPARSLCLPQPGLSRADAGRRRPASSLEMIEDIVQMEGPKECAAIMIEGYSGSSGIMQPSGAFYTGLREICDKLRDAADRRRSDERLRAHGRMVRHRPLPGRESRHYGVCEGRHLRLRAAGRRDCHRRNRRVLRRSRACKRG